MNALHILTVGLFALLTIAAMATWSWSLLIGSRKNEEALSIAATLLDRDEWTESEDLYRKLWSVGVQLTRDEFIDMLVAMVAADAAEEKRAPSLDPSADPWTTVRWYRRAAV